MHRVWFRKVDADGINILYREAGPRDAPAILLLHGFPSASHMFRDLIPLLADRFHTIAPARRVSMTNRSPPSQVLSQS